MMKRKRILVDSSVSFEEVFKRFLLSKKVNGLAEKTLATYQQHLSAIGKHLDLTINIYELNTNILEEMVSSMRDHSSTL